MKSALGHRAPIERLEGRQLFAIEYTLTPVAPVKVGPYNWFPTDVSDDGRIVVGSLYNGSVYTSYKWTAATGTVEIGTNLDVRKISGDGSTLLAFDYATNKPVVIDASGKRTTIPALSGDTQNSAAGISYDGKTVVGSSHTGNNDFEGFKWTAATGSVKLPTPATAVRYHAEGVSRDGNTVFGSFQEATLTAGGAVRWQGSGAAVPYAKVSGSSVGMYVEDVSDDGNAAAGWASSTDPNKSVRYVGTTSAARLGDITDKPTSRAEGISGDGATVVGWSRGGGSDTAWRWNAEEGLDELTTLIAPGSGWYFYQAVAIGASGHILVTGLNASGFSPALLTPLYAKVADGVLKVEGTGGNDVITFTVSGSNVIVKRGADTATHALADFDKVEVQAGNGDDRVDLGSLNKPAYLSGGSGADTLVGGPANDTILGGGGGDRLYGRDGNDRVSGSGSRDFVYGEAGDDRVYGDEGDDRVDGGGNKDRAYGGDGNDVVIGGGSVDRLYGDSGRDTLYGNDSNDYLGGGADADTLYGGAGNDVNLGVDAADLVDSVEVVA